MNKITHTWLITVQLLAATAIAQDNSKLPLVPPKSPHESMQCLKTHDDLRIELVAAEPLVSSPVAIDFGLDGRLWVVEMTDYARGVNDEFEAQGRVRFLTDTNDDGQFDKSTEFLTGLRFPTDVKIWRGGVLVCDAPQILFAEDTDGDGRADVRRVLFSGFATHNPHARVNSLRYALDGWVYGSGGIFGGEIANAEGKVVDVSNRDFRINPDAGIIEPLAGQSQQGRPRDDWDNWFGCDNSVLLEHLLLEDRYVRRNPHFAPPPASVYVPDYPNSQQLFPRGDLVLFKLSGPPGRPTAACGAEIYRDDKLGAEYAGNAFICEPVNQLVHRLVLSRNGPTFSGRRAANESDTEFLTSTDQWFRPVQAKTGPDGALWIVDMYRYLIEHPQWLPPEDVGKLNVLAGQDRGRIYRITKSSLHAEREGYFDSPNGVVRDLAQQQVFWERDLTAVPALERIASESRRPVARVQAMWTLAALGKLTPTHVLPLFASNHPELRRHALRLSEPFLHRGAAPELLDAALKLATDSAAEVRVQLANTLGESRDERAMLQLIEFLKSKKNEKYEGAAAWSSFHREHLSNVSLFFGLGRLDAETQATLAGIVAADGTDEQIQDTIRALLPPTERDFNESMSKSLARVIDGMDRRKITMAKILSDKLRRQITRLFDETRRVIAGSIEMENSPPEYVMDLFSRAGSTAVAALAGDQTQDVELLGRLLAPHHSPAIHAAAVRGLQRFGGARAADEFIQHFESATPRLRGEMLDAMLAREATIAATLAALEQGKLRPSDFDATRRQRLLTTKDNALRARAEQVFASTSGSKKDLLADWQTVKTMPGDSGRGKEVFQKRCSACHKLDGSGFDVGPDLAALSNRSSAALLVAILDPNRDVDGRYVNYVAVLAEGRTVVGLLVSETGTSVTLREPGGKEHVLLRRDLDELRATGKSVMPEGLEKDVTRQELADVITYLQPPRTPPKRFAGNEPAVIAPGQDGSLVLLATTAEVRGGDIVFETDSLFKNIGYWHGVRDVAGWHVELPNGGKFDVYLDYSCPDDSAGNGFRLEGAEPALRGIVASTGAWSAYRFAKIGTVDLPVGRGFISVGFDGEKRRAALMDLRGVHLVPSGTTPPFVVAPLPTTPASQIEALVKAITDAPSEYERIPAIWRIAIATGKRNQTDELRAVLDGSLPQLGHPLRDWQAVVIGGGIINGITQAGDWPKPRVESVLKVDGVFVARWQRAIELSAAMADDEKVPTGTRYDALRTVAMGAWDERGPLLRKYLAIGVHDELQMGAVSGVADVQHPRAAAALIDCLAHLSNENRALALDGLLRTPERCLALLDSVAKGKTDQTWLGAEREKKLRANASDLVRKRANEVLR